jgi:Ca2+-binding RTX toxin-like protein
MARIAPYTTITGTEGNDSLQGANVDPQVTVGNDIINALGGDDLIIGSSGRDVIDGGAGNDTVDYSQVNAVSGQNTRDGLSLRSDGGKLYNTFYSSYGTGADQSPTEVEATLTNVETIIGNPNLSNYIEDYSRRSELGRMDVDLAANRLTFYSKFDNIARTFTVKNFDNIYAIAGKNRLAGNDRDNKITGGYNDDYIIGSKGNDTLSGELLGSSYGGSFIDTLDYSNIGRAIKVSFSEKLSPNTINGIPETIATNEGTVDKGGLGTDKIASFNNIIGAIDKANTLDTSTVADGASVDLNLSNNSLHIKIPNLSAYSDGGQKLTVSNFVNAIGSKGNDTIVGANVDGKLTGGGGNDTITGGTKNDRLTGTDSTAKGVGEIDTLTGGGGKDKFILSDKNGAYYIGNGNYDYALITDFNIFQDSIGIGNLKDYSFAFAGGNTIDLFAGKDVNNRDLIAKIQIADLDVASLLKSANSSKSSFLNNGASSSIDLISSKIDILSGSNSTADAVI